MHSWNGCEGAQYPKSLYPVHSLLSSLQASMENKILELVFHTVVAMEVVLKKRAIPTFFGRDKFDEAH